MIVKVKRDWFNGVFLLVEERKLRITGLPFGCICRAGLLERERHLSGLKCPQRLPLFSLGKNLAKRSGQGWQHDGFPPFPFVFRIEGFENPDTVRIDTITFDPMIPGGYFSTDFDDGVFAELLGGIQVSEGNWVQPNPLSGVDVNPGATDRLAIFCTGVGIGLDGDQDLFGDKRQ